MLIPGLTRCFGKSAKQEIRATKQQANLPKPLRATQSLPIRSVSDTSRTTAPIRRVQTYSQPSQMDLFTASQTSQKAAEIVRKSNALPAPTSILRKPNGPAPISNNPSVTFDNTVKTRNVTFSPTDGEDVVLKSTLPLDGMPISRADSIYNAKDRCLRK